jgi:exodeoxyribonuclease VII small subunit
MGKIKKERSYQQALDELQNMVLQLEHEQVPLDALPDMIRNAGELLNWCKSKLRETEDEVRKITEGDEPAE